jgi:hypothetical protein
VWPNNTPQDNVVFIGSIMPTSPPYDTLVQPIENATGVGTVFRLIDASEGVYTQPRLACKIVN